MSSYSRKCSRILVYNECDVCVGDLIQLKRKSLRGIVRFIGEVRCMEWSCRTFGYNRFGIELFEPEGDSDGILHGDFFFECAPKHGVFVKGDAIDHIVTINYQLPRITIDEVIFMEKFQCRGRIRFIGPFPDSNPCAFQFGIELDRPNGTNDGHIGRRRYISDIAECHGVFVDDQELNDLKRTTRSSFLLHGFLKQSFIPQDILSVMVSYFPAVRAQRHKVMSFAIGEKTFKYKKYDMFDIDNRMVGPVILVPIDSTKTVPDDIRGIKINVTDSGWKEVFDEMAQKYGVTSSWLRRQLDAVCRCSVCEAVLSDTTATLNWLSRVDPVNHGGVHGMRFVERTQM